MTTPTPKSLSEELANAPEVGDGTIREATQGNPDVSHDNGADRREQAAGAEGSGSGLRRDDADADASRGPDGSDDRGGGGDPDRPRGHIWDGCPVTPLGVYGKESFYLDVRGQLIAVAKHDIETIRHLFGGRVELLGRHFPPEKRGNKSRFDQAAAATAMCKASDEAGIFNPARSVRGAGCWKDDDGNLIYHAGDAVLIDGEWKPPGRYGDKTYGAFEAIPRPSSTAAQRINPGAELLEYIGKWHWRREDVDPHILLGVIVAMVAGGALDWRPLTWLTADAAHGKSTLQQLILYVLGGDTGLVQSSDATKAGILSQVGLSALPVAIDEAEPDEHGKSRMGDIITAARIAASGGQFLRGSSDHKGHSGNVYSTFFFSSINIPPMKSQDVTRLIKLDLDVIPKDAEKVILDPRKLRRIGAGLRRRLVDGWPQWAERLDMWRVALGRHGISGRQADNYGTVLALADLVLNEQTPSDDVLANWGEKLEGVLATDPDDVTTNAGEMLDHLLTQPIDVWRRGRKFTVAEYLAWGARLPGAPDALGDAGDWKQANSLLAQYGLRINGEGEAATLSIANKKFANLCDLFEGSLWADGVWKQAAERVEGAQRGKNRTFARVGSRCTDIPFRSLPGMLNFPAKNDRVRADQARSASPSPDIDELG